MVTRKGNNHIHYRTGKKKLESKSRIFEMSKIIDIIHTGIKKLFSTFAILGNLNQAIKK